METEVRVAKERILELERKVAEQEHEIKLIQDHIKILNRNSTHMVWHDYEPTEND